jgi:hypothetical protein
LGISSNQHESASKEAISCVYPFIWFDVDSEIPHLDIPRLTANRTQPAEVYYTNLHGYLRLQDYLSAIRTDNPHRPWFIDI